MFKFIKTTVIGGLLFILPLVLIVVLIEKAIHRCAGRWRSCCRCSKAMTWRA